MNIVTSEANVQKGRKLILQLVFGGLLGGLAGYVGLGLLDTDNMTIDQVIVSGVGLIYLLMGLICGFGLIAPKLGSNILNFEDADEIRDQRRVLTGSTLCMMALGTALIVLPLGRADGPISPVAAFGGLLAAMALLIVVSIRDWKYYDEMMLQLSRDAGNLAFCGIGSLIFIWASAASLGLIAALTPLALVAIISGGFLIAIFVASARKGLMRTR